MLRKLGQNYQVAIPKEIVLQLGLSLDDYFDVRVDQNKIVLEPQVLIPKDQAYFYTKEWQEAEQEAARDIKEGRVTKTKNLKELLKRLDQ